MLFCFIYLFQVLFLALIIVFLLIFGIETSRLLVFFTSVFIPSVFIFGNSARTTFEALIFLFVVHPFDVGDRIFVDGQSMIVEVCVPFFLRRNLQSSPHPAF